MAPQSATRSRIETEAPEALQVDPGSVMTEELKARHPELPEPVFSTKALMYGREASGAAAIREGFAWNAQMDLLWALGYPHVVLIADGLPEGESRQSMIDHWHGGQRGGWMACSELANSLVIPRRGAHAVIYKLQHPDKDPFDLDDAAFQAISEPLELEPFETARLLRLLRSQEDLPRASLVIEALVGPSAVLEVLCSIAEDPGFDSRDDEFRGRAVSAMQPLLRRVPTSVGEAIKLRLHSIENQPEGFDSFVNNVTDPLADAQSDLNRSEPGYALDTLQWVDDHEGLLVQAYDARSEFPDIPSPRLMFAGGPALIEREAANAESYDSADVSEAYIYHYTTICSAKLLATELRYLLDPTGPRAPYPDRPVPDVTSWFLAHAKKLTPWLHELMHDESVAALARRALAITEPN